jgi:hypothetical protein
MRIKLNEAEQAIAKYLAKRRYGNNRASGVDNNRIGPQSDAETDLNGVGAELAFCKAFNIYPDLSVDVRHGGHDCVSPKGHKIDVKTTKYRAGRLLAVKSKTKPDADIYVLMIGRFPTYFWVGWATADELIDDDNLMDLGYGPTYALSQSELREPTA